MTDSSNKDTYWGNPPQTPEAHSAQDSKPQQPDQPQQSGQQPQPVQPQQSVAAPQPAQPQPPKKKHTTALVVGIIIACVLVVGIAGCAIGTFAFQTITSQVAQNQQDAFGNHNQQDNEPFALESSDVSDNNENFREYYGIRAAEEDNPLTEAELSQVADKLKNATSRNTQSGAQSGNQSDNQSATQPDSRSDTQSDAEGKSYQPGVYYVGKDLPSGTYWIQGDKSALSFYFVLSPAQTSSEASYNVWMVNHYYGNSIVEVSEGDVLVINQTAVPIDQVKQQFSSPYKSGMYRVGVDIPEGTYTVSAGSAHDYYAYYVMSDATYKGNCYVAYDTFLNVNSKPTITLEEGTYIELYNVVLTSNAT